MRPVYFILRVLLPYTFSVFFKRRKVINFQWKWFNQAIYVSNHPSAFLDPLIVANDQMSVINFMTRGDIFKTWLKPITWAAQMVPIYRTAEDGKDSIEKNKGVFRAAINILSKKGNLIMFGEGYTDNVFIRRLKPIKKGPARLGFEAMVATNWEKNIKIIPVCANYANPGKFRSEIVTVFSDHIYLKDYKELYEESPAKATNKLTRDIEKSMKSVITHIEDEELAPFLEQILSLTRKGLHHDNYDPSLKLRDRFRFTQAAANNLNENFDLENSEWQKTKDESEEYFSTIKKLGIDDKRLALPSNVLLRTLYLILGAPVALLGVIHCGIPYLVVKKMVERLFKRRVFWSGVKFLVGSLFAFLFNLPVIWIFYSYVYPSYWLGILFFLTVPAISFVFAYGYFKRIRSFAKWSKADKTNIEELKEKRKALLSSLDQLGF